MRWYFVVLRRAEKLGRAETEHHLVSLVFLEHIPPCCMLFGICTIEAWWKDESQELVKGKVLYIAGTRMTETFGCEKAVLEHSKSSNVHGGLRATFWFQTRT